MSNRGWLFIALLTAGCGGGAAPGDYQADFRTSNAFFTKMSKLEKGTSPHGSSRIWYSSNVRDMVQKESFSAPEGTVAIKEFDMASDGTSDGFAVMIKKPKGYDSANQDWYYDMRGMDGSVKEDPPPVENHRRASLGELADVPPAELDAAFVKAGFPPGKGFANLEPHARLVRGGVVSAGGAAATLASYETAHGPLSCQMFSARLDDLPPSADAHRQGSRTVYLVNREPLSVACWTDGPMLCALVGALPRTDLLLLAEREAMAG